MAKKAKKQTRKSQGISQRTRLIILPVMGIIGVGALVLAVLAVIVMPRLDAGNQRGVGANGFRAFEEKNGNLGIGKVVSKDAVVSALGSKAKSVKDVDVSTVFNIDGNRGQTATFAFTRSDGAKASVYIDLMLFKNPASLNAAYIYTNTVKTNDINGKSAYFMHAQTLGSDREYRLMVVNGLKVYKFVLVQPYRSLTINEVAALAVLKKIAAKAEL